MNILLALTPLTLTLIIVGASVFLIAILIVFYFLFIRNRALTHQVEELDRRYQYLHTLLTSQDQKYLDHIEEISQVNLLYSPIYDKEVARLNHLKDDHDVYASEKMGEFNSAINAKRYKSVRKEISEFKHFLNEFENDVNKLNDDLVRIIQPEEEANRELFEAKEKFNSIKQEYTLHLSDLGLLKQSYDEVFKYVEKMFKEYEQYVEKANYEDAANLLPSIHKVLSELDTINKVMPHLCVLASRDIPQRINDVEAEFKHMNAESYPIYHIVTSKQIDKLRKQVKDIVKDLKNFDYKGQEEKLMFINGKIETYLNAFLKERNDRKAFELERFISSAKTTSYSTASSSLLC